MYSNRLWFCLYDFKMQNIVTYLMTLPILSHKVSIIIIIYEQSLDNFMIVHKKAIIRYERS